MRRATRTNPPARGRRSAFTLVEMIVVIAIIALLVALTAAAVMEVLTVQQKRATDTTLQKVDSELNRQVKAVVDQARIEQIPAAVVSLANGDMNRARAIWIKLRLKQEFPTSYAEARNPAPGYLTGKNTYIKALPAGGANDPTTESGACLLLALTQGRRGVTWDPESTLGGGFVRDTDGDGVKELVDVWGKALYFVRWPVNNTDLNPQGLVTGTKDNQDPDGLLSSADWTTSANGTTFAALVGYSVAPQKAYVNLNPFVASSGVDGKQNTADDLYSYRLKSVGSKGD
jgi:prepilin-type N-terminal cleavage/methylation domain-containing protein